MRHNNNLVELNGGSAWKNTATGIEYPFSPSTRRIQFLLCRAGLAPLPRGYRVDTTFRVKGPNGNSIEILYDQHPALMKTSMEFLYSREASAQTPKEANDTTIT
ncbi:hypothetical protein [Lacipirellula parvula]|uniref:hypothetical protein n=1 Tax=Lacipirellula parvula TaxID=2650471 RepID=UPI00126040EA|nr:hypothetical protein [Lacipirellula parvula]